MNVPLQEKNGSIIVTEKAIKTVVGKSVIDSYGVKGMLSKNKIHDGVQTLLKHPDYSKGVEVSEHNKQLVVTIHLIAPFTNLVAVCTSIQSTVKYNLSVILGIKSPKVNIIIENVSIDSSNN